MRDTVIEKWIPLPLPWATLAAAFVYVLILTSVSLLFVVLFYSVDVLVFFQQFPSFALGYFISFYGFDF